MPKILSLVLLVGLAVGGYFVYQSRADKTASTQPATATAVVARGNIFQAVASTGRVVSNLDVEIKCKASGQIVQLPYDDVSQAVKKDALLVQVDPIDQQRATRQAEVALAQSQAKLAQAKQNLSVAEQTLATNREKIASQLKSTAANAKDAADKAKRRRELFEQKLSSPEELQTAETAATMAQAAHRDAQIAEADLKTQEMALEVKRQDIKLAEADEENDQILLATAKQRLSDTTVTAPMDGVVSALTVQRGQIIASGVTNVGGGTSVMILSDLSRVFVLASVDESDIGKIAVDQDVQISADAFPGTKFKGRVARIATKGVNVSNVVTFEVKIEVTSDNKVKLKPEMTANVQIVSASKQDVPVVPVNAVTRKQGKTYASVLDKSGKPEERAVQIGLTDGERTEIVAGLAEGDTVTYRKDEPQSRWREGGGTGPRPGGPGATMGFPAPGGGGGGRR